jgi:SpoVK/Ycf46/Vps4 family AAA+-type ATPase
LNPERLGDEAFLRRIQYKMLVRNPNVDEFMEIFERFCASMDLQYPDGLAHQFIEKHYRKAGKPLRRCHPRDVLSHAIDLIHFEKLSFALTEDLLDRAFESCFLEESEIDQ